MMEKVRVTNFRKLKKNWASYVKFPFNIGACWLQIKSWNWFILVENKFGTQKFTFVKLNYHDLTI